MSRSDVAFFDQGDHGCSQQPGNRGEIKDGAQRDVQGGEQEHTEKRPDEGAQVVAGCSSRLASR
jgi:hypothetical protein